MNKGSNQNYNDVFKNATVLFVDDEQFVREEAGEFLSLFFGKVLLASDGRQGFDLFQKYSPDAVVTDIRMPEMDGITLASLIKQHAADTPVIITTAFTETSYLLQAIEIGVERFIQKPVDGQELLDAIHKLLLPGLQKKKSDALSSAPASSLDLVIGNGSQMQLIIKKIEQVAPSNLSVLLEGETGAGKSFFARMIHTMSKRSDKPFVAVDIAAIPETLVESELFGYEKGAFTGAERHKKGFFQMAEGGTLFIDELENISPFVQSKLLRAVEEKRIFPVGGTTPLACDIRIIAATNSDISQDVREKKFREDLYYRLNEFLITIPPLRERADDIQWMAHKFCEEAAEEFDKNISAIAEEALTLMLQYPWPGNMRELKNVLRKAVLNCTGSSLEKEDIIPFLQEQLLHRKPPSPQPGRDAAHLHAYNFSFTSLHLQDIERQVIIRALEITGGQKMRAAALLGMGYKTFMARAKRHGIL